MKARSEYDCISAKDVMVSDIITVKPENDVAYAIKLLVENDISALPVVDDNGKVVGMLSEADLIRRTEIATEKHRPFWLEALTPGSTLAIEFAKSHGSRVSEVMTAEVVSASEDTPLREIATLLERHGIKRVPILRNGELVGIVSRSNLIQMLASSHPQTPTSVDSDRKIRLELLDLINSQSWTAEFGGVRNVIVNDGVVHLWGLVTSLEKHKALIALAEGVDGVVRISDEMITAY